MPSSTSVEDIQCVNLRKLISQILLRSFPFNFLATVSNQIDTVFFIKKGKWQAVTKCVREFCLVLVLEVKLTFGAHNLILHVTEFKLNAASSEL